ncbi:MAG: hypothetical protein NC124_02160 [Clostridium sp.]|nr:hypothetical protein [Clostridium sp.]
MPVRIKSAAAIKRKNDIKEYKENKYRRKWFVWKHTDKFQTFVDFYFAQKECKDDEVVIWRKVPKMYLNRIDAAINAIVGVK